VRLERVRPDVLRVTLYAYELVALMATARWACDGAKGELPPESVQQLRQVLDTYDAERDRLNR
jgi:hypothetical protein